MGIVHFAPVGTSPGAVTSALAYLHHHPEEKGDYPGEIIESVILFCSHEVHDGSCPADEYAWNDYGRPNTRQGWQRPKGSPSVLQVIRDFLKSEVLLGDHGDLYAWPMDVNHYEASFEAIARATMAVARGDSTGKYVWANLTGGTNVLNAALMQVASLSGLIGRMYYTFVAREADRRYLQPFSTDPARFSFVPLPLVKTTFDFGYYRLLEFLEDGSWHRGQELLSRLKGDADPSIQSTFGMSFDHFKNQYLNRMVGDELEEQRGATGEADRPVRLGPRGHQLLERIHQNKLVAALIHRERSEPALVQQCRDELTKYRL